MAGRVLTNGLGDQRSIVGQVLFKNANCYLLVLHSIIRYGSRLSGAIQGEGVAASRRLL